MTHSVTLPLQYNGMGHAQVTEDVGHCENLNISCKDLHVYICEFSVFKKFNSSLLYVFFIVKFIESVVAQWLGIASGTRGLTFDPCSRRGKFWCPNTLFLVSIAGMMLDKCIVLRIGTFTGQPLCRESHPLCRLKNPTVI